MGKKKRESLSKEEFAPNNKKPLSESNKAGEFAELVRRLEGKEPNGKENCDSLTEAALAAIEILGKSEETIERDPEVLAHLRKMEIEAWKKELKEKGIKGSYFTSEDPRSLEEKMPLAVLNGRRYPYIPVIEIIRLDAQSKGFKAKFFTQKGGVVCRLPDLDAAVRLLSEAEGLSELKDAAQEKDAPAYLKKALSYCDLYDEFWANEFANRKKKYGTPASILAKINNIETENEEKGSLSNERTAFYRFLRPFYFYEGNTTWPWATHAQTPDGDIAPISAPSLVNFDQLGSSLIRAIYPLKKTGDVFRFLLFPGYRKGQDEKLSITVREKKYSIRRNGTLIAGNGEGERVYFDEKSPESNWGFEKEIEAKLPELYQTLVPFQNSRRVRMLTYDEALENGLQGVEALFKGSSPSGLLPSMGGRRYSFVRDEYLYFFRALEKDSRSKTTPDSPHSICWDEEMWQTECTGAKLPAHSVASLKFSLRQVGLIEVKEDDIHDFFSFYFKALKNKGGRE